MRKIKDLSDAEAKEYSIDMTEANTAAIESVIRIADKYGISRDEAIKQFSTVMAIMAKFSSFKAMSSTRRKQMRIGVDVTVTRRDIRRLQKLDRALDRFQQKAERHIKGIGDFIGMTMAGIGLVTFVLAVISADGIPNEMLNSWVFVTMIGMLIGVGGCWLLGWMRE